MMSICVVPEASHRIFMLVLLKNEKRRVNRQASRMHVVRTVMCVQEAKIIVRR